MGAKAELSTLPRSRRWVNTITHRVVAVGGGAVIAAIALIFVYLLWVVAPIFAGAGLEAGQTYALRAAEPAFIEVNESGELGFRIAVDGEVEFFDLASGDVVNRTTLGRAVSRVTRVPSARIV